MNTAIYVFSGTGTSLAAATSVCEAIENAEIISIPQVLANTEDREIKIRAAKVGIIFPCYFGSTPQIVIDFVRKANFESVKYIFAVNTSGGNRGLSIESLREELNNKGSTLDYGKSISLSGNYIVTWYYNIFCKKGSKFENALTSFRNGLRQIASDIVIEKGFIEKSSYFQYKLSRFLSPKKVVEDTRPWDSEFNADENCNGCGICSKVCPVQNIRIVNHKPDFQHNCHRCMACIQYCPRNAIRYKNKVIKKPKYFHPDFPSKKMIAFVNHK